MLLKNSLFNISGKTLQIIIALIVTPIFVYKLGMHLYGIYTIIMSFAGYFVLLDLGIGQGVIKYLAECEKKDVRRIQKIFNSALIAQFFLGIICLSLIYNFSEIFVKILNIQQSHYSDSVIAFKIASFGLFGNLLANINLAAIKGLQRYDITTKITISASLFGSILGIVLILNGYGLLSLIIMEVTISTIVCIYSFFFLKKIVPNLKIGFYLEVNEFKKLLGYGGFVLIMRLASQLNNRAPSIVIGILLGPNYVTLYAVPNRLLNAVKAILNAATEVFVPWASSLSAADYKGKLSNYYYEASIIFSYISVFFYFMIFYWSKAILQVWMGKEFANEAWIVLSILSIASYASSLTLIPVNFALGIGYPRLVSFFSSCVFLITLILIIPFTKYWGINGAALTILLVQSNIIFLIYAINRLIGFNFRRYLLPSILKSILLCCGLGLLFGVIPVLIFNIKTRVQLVFISLYIAFYLSFLFKSKYFLSKDIKNKIISKIKRVKEIEIRPIETYEVH